MVNEHRCFLAIDMQPSLVEKIGEVQKEFKKTKNNVKYTEKENLHFTIKFFGNITEDKIDEIKNVIKKVIIKIKEESINDILDDADFKTELAIEGIGTFPNKKYMKVLWIGTKNNDFLTDLQKELDSEFEKIGFEKEKNFKTHLTIGRIRNLKYKKEFKEKIEELETINIGNMSISKISLKKSELTPEGPIYSDIEIFNI